MYLQDQIQMLIDRAHELHEELEKNERAINRLGIINEQIQEAMNEIEMCVEKFQALEEESQDELIVFDGQE